MAEETGYWSVADAARGNTGGGFKNDGKPNETDLTLSFVEHRAIEQQDIEKGF